jgi:hypothetical protein
MFWSSPSLDLRISLMLFVFSFLLSLVIFLIKKKLILSLFIFSLLGHLSFYILIPTNSLIFKVYDLYWLEDVLKIYWPIINLILLAILIINWSKNGKTKK